MTPEIALLLVQDGISTGAIYVLVGLGIVLIFLVTRVLFVPFGDLVGYSALTLAALQMKQLPGTVFLVLMLAAMATATEVYGLLRQGQRRRLPNAIVLYGVLPIVPAFLVWLAAGRELPMWLAVALTCAIMLPVAPLLYRVAFRPLADASVLVLLIVAVAVHFATSGLALVFFGPEGFRTEPMTRAFFQVGPFGVSGQTVLIVLSCAIVCLLLYLFFERTLTGKALRATAVNRIGARLVGILPSTTGATAFLLASALAALCGILIGPVTTLYYDSGFLIGLKAFVGAIIGGLISYPATAVGAILVGLFESYAAFVDSSLKEVFVFGALVPILIWQSLRAKGSIEEEIEEEEIVGSAVSARAARLVTILAIAFVAIAPAVLGSFTITLMNYIGIYALAALGLVLLTGCGGLISFGQAAFVGIGAYATAWYTAVQGGSPWIGLILALACSGLVATALGAATLRLSGHFLPLSTVAWGIAIFFLLGNIDALGRYSGLSGIPAISLGSISLAGTTANYFFIWALLGAVMLLARNLLDSRQGRAIRSLRGGIAMVESLAVGSFRTRLAVFVLAGMLAGLSGWLYAHLQRFVNPTPFDIRPGIELLLMALVGGPGRITGAVVGAAIVVLLKNVLQDVLPPITRYSAQLEVVFFGVLFVVLLQKARGGVVPLLARLLPRGEIIKPVTGAPLPPRAQPTAAAQSVLAIEGATKRFGALVAVNGVSFNVRSHEVLALIGPNGAGKSTLIDLITGMLALDAGRIRLLGADVSGLAPRHRAARGMARTFQHVKLRPNMTLIDNVLMGTYGRTRAGLWAGALRLDRAEERSARAAALRQLERVGLADRFDDVAGNLPLGQQRLLEVARALAADPVVVLLDEPAAGLRQLEKKMLADLLRSLRGEGMTIVLVEHDMDFVMNLVDRIVVMDFGVKLAEGLPVQIRADARVQEAYLGGVA
ncbi:MAG TPA: branched-chain amino acid ABC transporter permease/ATP-binding protein [Xanthobacteraceae bacterium]|nr:branched-chain amino acid ABC transporter permease/ATP-binding protein [Xanthobacteraceae bacterium]